MIATRTLIFVGVAAALSSGISSAEDPMQQGYLTDTQGRIVTSGTGLCWQHRDVDRPSATGPCIAAAPVAVAPAPRIAAVTPPQRAPAPAPAKMLPQKINFSADALFDFDKAVLKPEGKAMLDDLARTLQGANYNVIATTGHTDRFGTDDYNQKLSMRRANAVKDYLTSRDIAANMISVDGKGETQPVTKAGDCQGAKSAKVIACLQPDRRVDVEVTGTEKAASAAQ